MFGRSFRARLTSFFIVIVILPMLAVSVILFRLVSDSEQGKADARVSQAQTTAGHLYRQAQEDASAAGRAIGESPDFAQAVEARDRERIADALESLGRDQGVVRSFLRLARGPTVETGGSAGIAHATTSLVDREGDPAGRLTLSTTAASEYANSVRDTTGLEAIVLLGGRTVATTLEGVEGTGLPDRGDQEVGGRKYRLGSFTATGFDGSTNVKVRLLADQHDTESTITSDSLVVGALLLAFLILAFAFALTVSRALQAQIQRLLQAARRLGGGDFDVEVPTEGNDEFAALGSEFNAMARQLENRLKELQTERTRLQHAIRRVGESFAKGLDRDALLEIVVHTAVDGVAADVGRATVREAPGGPMTERARVGNLSPYDGVMRAAESAVLERREPAEASVSGLNALCHPLHPSDGEGNKVIGLVTVARNSRPFSDSEKELFSYLASQAAVSIENVDLHETVQRQAVTDELTGLFNHRRFQEVMAVEVERSKRFNQHLGLIMLDIDNFKNVNDTYGHLQGDQVLREVARVLLETCREVDEPARYGGEEMAVALPQTDLDGAVLFAERLRRRIEGLDIAMVDGSTNGPLKITASFGAAALPDSAATDKDALVAAADSALYRAKRLGKNRVVKAG